MAKQIMFDESARQKVVEGVKKLAKVVKVIKSGSLTKAVKLSGVGATAGAKAAIEAAGGSVA